jgi:hypothetical protein
MAPEPPLAAKVLAVEAAMADMARREPAAMRAVREMVACRLFIMVPE